MDTISRSWSDNLATLRDKRASAIANGDTDTLRTMLHRAITFAALTIQCKTAMAERDFEAFCNDGTIGAYLRTNRERAISTSRAWLDTLTIEDFQRYAQDGWTLARDIELNVSGVGVAKASFSAALFGATETYCIDVWGTRYAIVKNGTIAHDIDTWQDAFGRCKNTPTKANPCDCNSHVAETVRAQWSSKRADRWDIYRTLGDATFGDAAGQWSFFAQADPVFDADGHASYFRHVI